MVPNVDLRKMQQFLTIVEQNSFTRAAEKLHIAQPALSIAIKKLEGAVGVPLIDRKANSFEITAAGKDFVKHCKICLNHVERAVWSARSISSGNVGTLDIGFVSSTAHTVLPQKLPILLKKYPNIKLNLMESTSNDIIRMLVDAQIDVGLLRGPLNLPAEIEIIKLARDEFVLMVANNHPLLDCLQITPTLLSAENFIMYSTNSPLRNSAFMFCKDNQFEPAVAQEAIQIQTVAVMVGCGLGVALVPKTTVPGIKGAVEFINLDSFSHQFNTEIYMAKKKDHHSTLLDELFSFK